MANSFRSSGDSSPLAPRGGVFMAIGSVVALRVVFCVVVAIGADIFDKIGNTLFNKVQKDSTKLGILSSTKRSTLLLMAKFPVEKSKKKKKPKMAPTCMPRVRKEVPNPPALATQFVL
jgi:hypothetical protein